MNKTARKYTTVSIPEHLADKARGHIKGTGFANLSDYVTFILREIISGKEESKKSSDSKADEEKVLEKLRKLGYL